MLWSILGAICIILAIYLIHTVGEIKLGSYSGRFVTSIFTVIGYFLVSKSLNIAQPTIVLIKWLVPAILIVSTIIYGIMIYQNYEEEFDNFIGKVPQIFSAIILTIIAKWLFTL